MDAEVVSIARWVLSIAAVITLAAIALVSYLNRAIEADDSRVPVLVRFRPLGFAGMALVVGLIWGWFMYAIPHVRVGPGAGVAVSLVPVLVILLSVPLTERTGRTFDLIEAEATS